MVLGGTEIKSLRAGKGSFNDSYCVVHQGELLFVGVVVIETVLMHVELELNAIGFVHDENMDCVRVKHDFIFFILEREDVGDCFRIESYFTVVSQMSLLVGV